MEIVRVISFYNWTCSITYNLSFTTVLLAKKKREENETNHKVKRILCLTFFPLYPLLTLWYFCLPSWVYKTGFIIKGDINLHVICIQTNIKNNILRFCNIKNKFFFLVSSLWKSVDNTSLNAFFLHLFHCLHTYMDILFESTSGILWASFVSVCDDKEEKSPKSENKIFYEFFPLYQ